jgi:hypothetical protein
MRQHKIPENRSHKRIGSFREESVDPGLEAAAESELCTEHLVLAKNEKEHAHCNAQHRNNHCIPIILRINGPHATVLSFQGESKGAYANTKQVFGANVLLLLNGKGRISRWLPRT